MSINKIECPLIDIPEYNYNCWSVVSSSLECSELSFLDFFSNFMIKNTPCIIRNIASEWECTKKWVCNNEINYDYLKDKYGNLEAPVADCNNIQYNSHCKIDMKVTEYMDYMKHHKDNRLLYLKDWHLRRNKPDDNFYEIPIFFALDWLNEFAMDNNEDDFMFVYIGPKGSWTPLHEDVYCSYSWSVNIVGRKKWILFPPGEEDKLKDSFGNLPLLFEAEKHTNVKYYEIIQEKGDAIFVPSGWHHQVANELNTISVNHNWINACNVHIVWTALQTNLTMVEHQIEEFKDSPEYSSQCQLILKSLFGMDFKDFISFLCYIAKKRLNQLEGKSRMGLSKYILGIDTIKFDLIHILKVMESITTHPIFLNKQNILPSITEDIIKIKHEITEKCH
ncbi:jumonji domain containing 4 [Anticarsia gemmatalis]|uniref:jumonji domain containing 4 n=1 Tax=Anticarsia gemmatalis TaxID=129554 RepID=UPI003F757928